MPRPNPQTIHRAIVALLQADSELASLQPDGVYWAMATPGRTRYVVVGLWNCGTVELYGQPAYLVPFYFVKAVSLSTVASLTTTRAAAARIDTLLCENPLVVAPDYVHMATVLDDVDGLIDDTVPDKVDLSLKWFHCGGNYRVSCAWPDPVRA